MSSTTPPAPASHPVADVESIRRQFPALRRLHNGRPVAYFDGPGGTQVPQAVADAVSDYLLHHNANTHWRYPTSIETDAALTAARRAVADFLNGDPSEVAFGANMTTLTFHVGRALGRGWLAGDEIVVTELDHHANVDPWRALERDRGMVVRAVRVDLSTCQLDWDDFATKVNARTKLVAVGGASNAVGTINDIRRAADLARAVGALLFVDAVHYAPHVLVDVGSLGCDLLACSAYKFYGPHEGILWGRRDLLASLDLPKLRPAPAVPPDSLETGTQNHEGIVGTAAAIDFLAGLDREGDRRAALVNTFGELHRRGAVLVHRLWTGLAEIRGVTLYGPPPDAIRTPTVSFSVKGRSSDEVAAALAERAVFVSNGDFYATTLIDKLGLSSVGGAVRAGCACYTTAEEVDRLVDAVREVTGGGR
jgi:cysteine desulfurase family protein (TIGR01976 family)